MSTTVKTGWLKDKNGDKFAPKTLTSQVQTSDGILIEDKIQTDLESVKTYINTKLSELPDPVVYPASASVGQTIVVKEVDENGKPTKWESADYQPRTHWEEEKAIITDAPIIRDEEIDIVGFNADIEFVPGCYYTATYNGEKHTALCHQYTFEGETVVFVGNGGIQGLEDTGESFFMFCIPDDEFVVFIPMDVMNGEAEMPTSVSVTETTRVKIPTKYVPSLEEMRTNIAVILPETTVEIDVEQGFGVIPHDFTLEEGKEYTVRYNGVDYIVSNGIQMEGVFAMGNMGAIEEGVPVTNDPFVIASEEGENVDGSGFVRVWMVFSLDGSTSVTLSIKEIKSVTVPPRYLPDSIGYSEHAVVLPETEGVLDEEQGIYIFNTNISLVVGKTYIVNYCGVPYKCIADEFGGVLFLGNLDAYIGIGNSGEPFALILDHGIPFIAPLLELEGPMTVSITLDNIVPVPAKYLPDSVPFDESVELISETTPTIVEDGNGVLFIASDVKFIPNETYEIMYAGTKYTCTAYADVSATTDGTVIIGNLAWIGMENTGEPFVMATMLTEAAVVVFPLAPGALPTVSIAKIKFQKISARCLPDNVGGLGLPKVSADDNGAILRVVDGAWAITRLPSVEEEGEF